MKRLVAIVALCMLAATALAAPLQTSDLSADAKWAVHVDADALRAAEHLWPAVQQAARQGPAPGRLEWLDEHLGLDPEKDLKSITFYGTCFEEGQGAAIVRADADAGRLAAFFKKQPGYQASTHRAHRVHRFEVRRPQRGSEEDAHDEVVGCLVRPGVFVFTSNTADLTAALDVLDKKSPSLKADSPLAREIPPGTIFWLAATELDDAKLPFKSPFAKLSKQLHVAVGQQGSDVFLNAGLETGSKKDAEELRQAMVGFRMLAKQPLGSRPELLKMLENIDVGAEGQSVHLHWKMPGDQLAKMMENLPQPRTDRQNQWREREEEQRKRFLERYDKNRNGKIDEDEREAIRAEWSKAAQQRRAEYHKQMLEKYDTNRNGKIDDEEKDAMRAEWAKRMEQMRSRGRQR